MTTIHNHKVDTLGLSPALTRDFSAQPNAVTEAFALTLRRLDDRSYAGIKAVKTALLRVIDHVKAETSRSKLARSVEHLAFLCFRIALYPDAGASFDSACEKRKDELTKLADDMDLVAKREKPIEFLNPSSSVAMLDSIILELTIVLCMNTDETQPKLDKAFKEAVSAAAETDNASGAGVFAFVKGNTVGDITGSFFGNNEAYEDAAIRHHFEDNKIGKVGGSLFTGNKAGMRLPQDHAPPMDVTSYGVPPPAGPNPEAQADTD